MPNFTTLIRLGVIAILCGTTLIRAEDPPPNRLVSAQIAGRPVEMLPDGRFKWTGPDENIAPTSSSNIYLRRIALTDGQTERGGFVFAQVVGTDRVLAISKKYFDLYTAETEETAAVQLIAGQNTVLEAVNSPPPPECEQTSTPPAATTHHVFPSVPKPLNITFKPGNVLSHGPSKVEEQMVFWNECENRKGLYGNFSGYDCSERREMSKALADFIDENFSRCVSEGLTKLQIANEVSAIKLVHNGLAADQNHLPRSYHSLNRAIDVKSLSITLKPRNGVMEMKYEIAAEAEALVKRGFERQLTAVQKKNRAFWQGFRSCWTDAVQAHFANPACSEQSGTVGCEDHAHQHHLHLSLPFCPNRVNGYQFNSSQLETWHEVLYAIHAPINPACSPDDVIQLGAPACVF
ncbi:MAG: hypothetical protein AB7P04_16125 [Bacteriovoracia bacterium]